MGIAVTCSQCGASFAAKDEHAGRRAKCGKCGSPIPIPAAPAASAAGITVTCSACGASFRAKLEHAGRRGKCARCQTAIEIPHPATAPAETAAEEPPVAMPVFDETAGEPPGEAIAAAVSMGASAEAAPAVAAGPAQPSTPALSPQELGQQVLGAFQGEIEPVKVSVGYRFGILLVAVVMILLPLLYVALIGVAGYLVYLHAVYNTGLLSMGSGRGRLMAVIVYVGPMIAGVILVAFMIKPLFARPAKAGRTRSLTPRSDPLLFAFVERICAIVRAPQPKEIRVDCEVNASASFRHGMLSMLGNDLALTIGMPLAAGLNLRQFAGVLAHEFGHFAQGAGMRLTYVIRSISWWFTRVVYERDEWDEQLKQWAGADARIAVVIWMAQICVWGTRKILWVLMMTGHVVAGLMLRQMEFDADRYEARMAGSDSFESTSRRLNVLNVASQGAHADLGEFYKEGRLGDNLPRLVLANVDQIPAEILQRLEKMAAEAATGLLDTHPADKDRIASARRENAPGIFRLDYPATVLFSDFEQLSRNVTWDFYREVFGSKFQPSQMHPVDDLLARQGKRMAAGEALERVFQGAFRVLRPLPFPRTQAAVPSDPQQCAAQLKQARQRMHASAAAHVQAYESFHQADQHQVEAEQAAALHHAKIRVRADTFSLPLNSTGAAARTRREAGLQKNQLGPRLAEFEQAAVDRVLGAVDLLEVPQVAGKINNAERLKRQCARVLPVLAHLGRRLDRILQFRDAHMALAALVAQLEGNEENEKLIETVRSQLQTNARLLGELRQTLQPIAYPFDHAKGEISVAQYALEHLPPADNLGAVYQVGDDLLDTLPALYVRLAGQLAVAVEEVEKALGLPPAPKPAEPAPS